MCLKLEWACSSCFVRKTQRVQAHKAAQTSPPSAAHTAQLHHIHPAPSSTITHPCASGTAWSATCRARSGHGRRSPPPPRRPCCAWGCTWACPCPAGWSRCRPPVDPRPAWVGVGDVVVVVVVVTRARTHARSVPLCPSLTCTDAGRGVQRESHESHAHKGARMHACMVTHTHARMHACMVTREHARMHASMVTHEHARMHAGAHVLAQVHARAHAHTQACAPGPWHR